LDNDVERNDDMIHKLLNMLIAIGAALKLKGLITLNNVTHLCWQTKISPLINS